MQKKLSRSVRISYFDKKSVEESLREYLKEIEGKHPEVERVLLFGSRFLPSRFPVGMDVFPYTEEEMEKMKEEGNFFIRRALEEGVEIFRRR